MYLPEKLPNVVTVPSGPYHELAEAIRRGCVLRPHQAFNVYEDGLRVCALGAAALGSDILVRPVGPLGPSFHLTKELRHRFPLLMERTVMPCSHELEASVLEAVVHLNDSERWSRERIADWLDAL